MQPTSVIYRALRLQRHYVEYKAEIAGETYNQADIVGDNPPQISTALLDKFSVGNVSSATLKISLKPKGTIPDMARVDVYFRLKTMMQATSPWMPKGQFFIDVRSKDINGILTLECFDAMLKTNYTFMESGSWTSTTALATVQMIATDIGVTIESGTLTLLTNDPKPVPIVPVIGENGTTGREMLEAIAAIYGGNFIIDELGQLKLVQLVAPVDTLDIGVQASGLGVAPAFDAIDRVILYSGQDKKTGYRSPESTFDSLTGRILEACCPWTTQELADDLLAIVNGYVYQPFGASGANIDPIMQLGDGITVNGTTSVIFSAHITLNARCAADLSAPYEEEINHEYPYRSPAQRTIDDAVTQEDLIKPGGTEINGANIVTGTITLGGNNNGRGELHILDENSSEIGQWDNSRLTIRDDTATDNLLEKAKFAVIRKESPDDTPFGVFIGCTQVWNAFFPGQYPNENVPFIFLDGTRDGTQGNGDTEIFAGYILLNGDTRISGYSDDRTVTFTKTDNSSTANLTSYSVKYWGRVVQLTIHLTNVNYANPGDVLWAGTISGTDVDKIMPVDTVTSVGINGANSCAGQLYESNGDLLLSVRALNGYQANWTGNLSFTFLV